MELRQAKTGQATLRLTGGAGRETGYAAAELEKAVRSAEAWATGRRGGADVPGSDETFHNNSRWYAAQAANAAAVSDQSAGLADRAAARAAGSAADAAQSAEITAAAAAQADSSAADAAVCANAARNAQAAAEAAGSEAEAWAVGERLGEEVQSADTTYRNNARYYARQAAEELGRWKRAIQTLFGESTLDMFVLDSSSIF